MDIYRHERMSRKQEGCAIFGKSQKCGHKYFWLLTDDILKPLTIFACSSLDNVERILKLNFKNV